MSNLSEKLAARKSLRFQAFVEAKDAYEAFVHETSVRFDQISEEHYSRARRDPRLRVAERGFTTAIQMSEAEDALADAAVARYQLGMVRHIRGELDEAAELMRSALQVFSNLFQRNRAADMSACHYHLGVIALKQRRLSDAVRELRRSRQMDAVNADPRGMQSCDLALAACAEAGADIKATIPLSPGDADDWDAPETAMLDGYAEGPVDLEIKPGTIRYDRRELIWLASYSIQANDALMAHLNSLGDEFGRPVSVSRVAFGSDDPAQCDLRQPEWDQHLCATILVLEKAGLNDPAFQELAAASMKRVLALPDFRLLVYLHDLTMDELRDLSESLVKDLFDTTQVAESPSLEQLRRTLVPYVRQVERIRAAAHWRELRLRLARVCGNLATVILIAAASLSLLGFPAWLLKSKLDWLGPQGPQLASLVLGVLAFPVQAPLIFLLLRGLRTATIAPRDNISLMHWILVGVVIMLGASHFQHTLGGPYSWLFLGLAIGVLLDSIRRAGGQARRQMIDLEALGERGADPAMQDPKATVLRGDPLNPFSCPLLPRLLPRVFISYTRRSAKGSRLAAALHSGLKAAGASPFLDRASISAGASWRRALNHHLGESDVFLCILDEKSVQQKWVAAELLGAIEGNRLTTAPEIVILVDPAIQHPSQPMLPVFRGVVSASASPQIPGRPQIVQLNALTRSSLAWALAPTRFIATSVFTRGAALPIMFAMNLLARIGGLGILTGLILGFLAMLDMTSKLPLASGLAHRGWLEPLMLLSAFWLGFTARATIAWGFEREHDRKMGVTIPAIATCGLAYAFLLFVRRASILDLGWSVALLVAGWMLVASTIRIGMSTRRIPET